MENTTTFFNIQSGKFIFKHIQDETTDSKNFSLHTHQVPELLYMVAVDGCHIIEDKEYPLSPGDLIVVPPAAYHYIKLNPHAPYERYNICFDLKILHKIDVDAIYKKLHVMHCIGHPTIPDIFFKTDYYAKCLSTGEFIDVTHMLIQELFYNLSVYNGTTSIKPIVLNPLLAKVLDYINKNLFTLQSVSEISRHLYITEGYLFEIFKTQLQITPKKYITAKRLHAARQEIVAGAKPTEIYERVGFHDYTSFYRNYISFFGHTPSQEASFGFSNAKFK